MKKLKEWWLKLTKRVKPEKPTNQNVLLYSELIWARPYFFRKSVQVAYRDKGKRTSWRQIPIQ